MLVLVVEHVLLTRLFNIDEHKRCAGPASGNPEDCIHVVEGTRGRCGGNGAPSQRNRPVCNLKKKKIQLLSRFPRVCRPAPRLLVIWKIRLILRQYQGKRQYLNAIFETTPPSFTIEYSGSLHVPAAPAPGYDRVLLARHPNIQQSIAQARGV